MPKNKVQSVTSLPDSPEVERRKRFISYLIAMGIRLACIPLVIVIPYPFNLLAIVGAVFIPFFAVVDANSKKVGSGDVKAVDVKPLRIESNNVE